MKIDIQKRWCTALKNLDPGDVFEYINGLYMKGTTDMAWPQPVGKVYLVVDLVNGTILTMSYDLEVYKVKNVKLIQEDSDVLPR